MKLDQSLQWAKARYRSAAGLYESGWYIDEVGQMTIEITIPFNASAKVVLPQAKINKILINGRKIIEEQRIDFSQELILPSGHYKIEYQSSSAVYEEEKPSS